MAKRLNPNLVKIHRNYTVEEIATLLVVHKNSVLSWVRSGLAVAVKQKPMLILGSELKRFLRERRVAAKRKCAINEMYCMKCKAPRKPAGNMVDYMSCKGSAGRLVAMCDTCGGLVNRFVKSTDLAKFAGIFDLTLPSD